MNIISGTVSHMQQSTEVTGTIGRRGGQISSSSVIKLRVDDKPVEIKLKESIDISDGEQATVAGKEKNGIFKGIVIRNDKTGVLYSFSIIGSFISAILLIIIGAFLSFLIVGIPVLLYGFWLLYEAINRSKAKNMLATMPAVSTSS